MVKKAVPGCAELVKTSNLINSSLTKTNDTKVWEAGVNIEIYDAFLDCKSFDVGA